MDNVLTLEIQEDPQNFLDWARQEVRLRAGSLVGDVNRGKFCIVIPLGLLLGQYRLLERQLTLMVTSKPFLLSAAELKNQLMQLLGQRAVEANGRAMQTGETRS